MNLITDLTLADCMTRQLFSVHPDVTLGTAVALMRKHHISSILVQSAGRPLGIVTEHDLVRRLLKPVEHQTPIHRIMSSPLVTVPPHLPFAKAYALCQERNLHHLVVVDAEGHALGIVTNTDFRTHLGRDLLTRLGRVDGLMERDIPLLPKGISIDTAVSLMIERKGTYVLVVDGHTPLGIITERDLASLAGDESVSLDDTLETLCSKPVKTLPIAASVMGATQAMSDWGVRHLVILNAQKRIEGVLTQQRILDLVGLRIIEDATHYQQALREEKALMEARVKLAIEATGLGIWELNVRDQSLYWSESLRTMLGYDSKGGPTSLANWYQFVHPDDAPSLQPEVTRALGPGFPIYEAEYRLKQADGGWRWVHSRGRVVKVDDNGKPILAIGTTEDISQRKGAETLLRESESRFRSYIESSPIAIFVLDRTGHHIDCNPAATLLLGYDQPTLRRKTIQDVICPNRLAQQPLDFERVFREGTLEGEYPLVDHKGSLHDVLVRAARIDDNRMVAFCQDITDRKKVEQDLRVSAVALESTEAMLITDARGIIQRVNAAFTQVTGYSAVEAIGKTPGMLQSCKHDKAFYDQFWQELNTRGQWHGEIWNRRKNGGVYPERLTVSAVRDENGQLSHFVATFLDITQKKRAEEEIRNLAFFDPLTHLPNRRLLLDRLRVAMLAGMRRPHYGALLFIDLDNFKTLNDTLGHDKGDQLLVQVGERLRNCIRQEDTVARLGGDEFVVLADNLGSSSQQAAIHAEALGSKILQQLAEPYLIAGHERRTSSSIGITLFMDEELTIEELLKRADLAVYRAKAAGRNTLRFFDPAMQVEVERRARIEHELRQSLTQGDVEIFYQPQVGRHGQLIGYEALARWRHPERGLVSPLEFIPIAEETGLILPLGLRVLELACQRLASWANNPATSHLLLAVNVSVRQFIDDDFVRQLKTLLVRTGAPPERLKLELTESLFVNDADGAAARMEELQALGLKFALDDFGTGYSSMAYLKRLPVNQLKIDQSFVRDILTDPNDAAITRAIIAMGHSLGMEVIAEGVETEAQWHMLKAAGCYEAQGYLFGRPSPTPMPLGPSLVSASA